jgi:uncharacterized membrane protein YhhN
MPETLLSIGAFASAVFCIRGKYLPSDRLVYLFKPTTTILIIGVALVSGALTSGYGRLVLLSMLFALAGDVFLMMPRDRFLQGLLSFFAAHVVLTTAFALQALGFTWWLFGPVAAVGAGMYGLLAPHLGRLRLPVIAYIVAIGTMTWFGLERWHVQGTGSALLAATGAILFLLSDSILGLNRFRRRFRAAEWLVLSTYWTSIWLTALSVDPARM